MVLSPSQVKGVRSPLVHLASLLYQARTTAEVISVPLDLCNAVQQHLNAVRILPVNEITMIVDALDSEASSICTRFNDKAFMIILSVLRSSKACWAQNRGLCLLTHSICSRESSGPRDQSTVPLRENAHLAARKARIGPRILHILLSYFCNRNGADGSRRWMGILALELLKENPENQSSFRAGPESRRRNLGQLVIDERNEVLRLIAGSIIREMVATDMAEDMFWPVDIDAAAYAGFPKSQHHTLQWVESFEFHLVELFSRMDRKDQSFVRFASGLKLGELDYSFDGASAILVTVDDFLSIVVPGDTVIATKYIDLPIDSISVIEIHESGGRLQSSCDISIDLFQGEASPVYLNAAEYLVPVVILEVDNYTTARDIEARIINHQFKRNNRFRNAFRESDILDVSQREDGLGSDLESTNFAHGLMNAKAAVNTLASKEDAERIMTPLERAQSPEQTSTSSSHRERRIQRFAAISPIGTVLEVKRMIHDGVSPNDLDQKSNILQNLSQQTNDSNSSFNSVMSSINWGRGASAIENASEFRSQQTGLQMQEADQDEMLPSDRTPNKFQSPDRDRASSLSPTRQAIAGSEKTTNGITSNLSGLHLSIHSSSITISKVGHSGASHEVDHQSKLSKEITSPTKKPTGMNKERKPTVAQKASKQRMSIPIDKEAAGWKAEVREIQPSEKVALSVDGEKDDVFDIPGSPAGRISVKPVRKSKQKTYSRSSKKTAKPKQTDKKTTTQTRGRKKKRPNGKSALWEKHDPDSSYKEGRYEAESDKIQDDGPSTGRRRLDLAKTLPISTSKVVPPHDVVAASTASPTDMKSTVYKSTVKKVSPSAKKRQPAPAIATRSRPQRAAAIQAKQKMQSHAVDYGISSQVVIEESTVQDENHEVNVDTSLKPDHDTNVPNQVPSLIGSAKRHEALTSRAIEQEGLILEEEENPQNSVLQPGSEGSMSDYDRNSILDTDNLRLQPGKVRALPSLLEAQERQQREGDLNECEKMVQSEETHQTASDTDTDKPNTNNMGKKGNSNGHKIAAISLQSIVIPLDSKSLAAGLEHGHRVERENLLISDISQKVGVKEKVAISAPGDLDRPATGQEIVCSADFVTSLADDLETAIDVAGSAIAHRERINDPSMSEFREHVDGTSTHGFSNEQLNQHFDQAKAFTDLDNVNSLELSTPKAVTPRLPISKEPGDRESVGLYGLPRTAGVSNSKDQSNEIFGIRQDETIDKDGRTEKAQKIEISQATKDPFAVRLDVALSSIIPRVEPAISKLYRRTRTLSGFQLTPETSTTHQQQDQSEILTSKNTEAGSKHSSDYPIRYPQHSRALNDTQLADSSTRASLIVPQKALLAPEAVMVAPKLVNRKDDIARARVKAEAQKSQIISISSRESTHCENSSNIQEQKQRVYPTQEPLLKSKRKFDDTIERQSKKFKVFVPNRIKSTATSREKIITPYKLERDVLQPKTEEYLNRKSAIISFGVEEPRNQGTLSKQIPIQNNSINYEDLHIAVAQVSSAQKRKKHTSGIKKIYGKRRRLEIEVSVSPTPRVDSKIDERKQSPALLIPSRYHGSQSTKVDSKGSPIPLPHPRVPKISVGRDIHELMSSLTDADDNNLWNKDLASEEDTTMMMHNDILSPELNLPRLQSGHPPRVNGIITLSSSIGKLLPSSPNAPSRMLQDLTAHRLQPGGDFVNVQTESIVKAANLQDPFLGKSEGRASNFLQKLRASHQSTQGETFGTFRGNVIKKEHVRRRGPFTTLHEQDPDKTLVEARSGPYGEYGEPSSPSSANSSSSWSSRNLKQPPPSSAPSCDAIYVNASKQWREALRPHQHGTLEVLYDMSNHLVRHLIDKETAVDDLVKEYERGGSRLIEELDKAQQQEHEQHKTHVGEVRKKMMKSFGDLSADLGRGLKETRKARIGDFAKNWKVEQQKIRDSLETALLACGE